MKKIDPKAVRRQTLIPFMKHNYNDLNKGQIFNIAVNYMEAVYLRNGNIHVAATNEMLKRVGQDDERK